MCLEELKALKEKSDKLVETLQNDRQILQSTVNKIREDNSKDFQEFLDSLKEYAELLPEGVNTEWIGTISLFGKFDKHYYGFCSDDTWVHAYDNKIHFLCANGDEEYIIDIGRDKATCTYPEHHHSYSHIYFDDFKKFILEHREEFKDYVEQVIKMALDKYVADNKKKNDSLFQRAEELNR